MNSLLIDSKLPLLADFKAGEVLEAVDTGIKNCLEAKDQMLKKNSVAWSETLADFEEKNDTLSEIFSTINHLNAVANSDDLREEYAYAISKLTEYGTKISQDVELYKFFKKVLKENKNLDKVQQYMVIESIKGFELSGVGLDDENKKIYSEYVQQQASVQNKFENNILDSTMAWSYTTDNKEELAGMSEDKIASFLQKSKQKESDKKYYLGLDAPTYIAVLQEADSRELREKFYKAFVTKASSYAEHKEYNNDDLITEILMLRNKKIKMLGFKNYAEYPLESKMAESPQQVFEMLEDLLEKSYSQAKAEREELKAFAKEQGLQDKLRAWDSAYYSEKLKKHKFNFNEQELKDYFPVKKVLYGLFKILEKIYGVTAKEYTDFKKYDKNVKAFEFLDKNGIRGYIICDLFANEHKRSGAWMDGSRTHFIKKDGSIKLPVAYVNCNFMPPVKDKITTITHNDVVTLFHEFGHALHHILSKVLYPSVSGTNGVEWDAVELPSQFMENFCWSRDGLLLISEHYQTQEKLSNEIIDKLIISRQFQSALRMLRQIEFGLFDMQLHFENITNYQDVQKTLDRVREKTAFSKSPDYNKFQNSFAHIFAGGYSAGYYSYKWAEILSSDAFGMFEECGNVFSSTAGANFLANILEKGGSEPAKDLYKKFRGREPSIEALLRHSGIKCE